MSNQESKNRSKLYNTLKAYTETIRSYHMPGHKNGRLPLIEDIYDLDVTEVPGTDDMHHPEDILQESLDEISRVYGSGKSYFLVNGSTGGILTAVSGVCGFGDRILVARNCHKSVYNAILIRGLDPTYIYPDYNESYGFYGKISLDDLKAFEEEGFDFHGLKAMVMTSPTYEGQVSDIKGISAFLHERGVLLIVDEAHGSHLNFCQYEPASALSLGADLVIQSTHKTLPCLTQTGLFHVSSQAIDEKRVSLTNLERYLGIYQSSSPSYVFMTSIVEGVAYMEGNRERLNGLAVNIKEQVSKRNKDSKHIQWLAGSDQDVFKLSGLVTGQGSPFQAGKVTGWEIEKALREIKDIQVEMSGQNHIVGIVTIADDIEDVNAFMDAVEDITDRLVKTNQKRGIGRDEEEKSLPFQRPMGLMSIHQVEGREKSLIDIEKAGGKIAGDFIIPYPPGIPLLVPGEKIEDSHINLIRSRMNHNKEVYGVTKRQEICYTYVIDNNSADD